MNNTTDPIVDADVVESTESNTPAANQAIVLLEIEATIKNHIADLDRRKADLKKEREMLASTLENNETYREHDKLAKDAAKVKAATRSDIMQEPANRALADKVKELTSDVKEIDGALSDYLREYQRLSGSNEIEGHDGEVREIVYAAKLVKKSNRR